jgi:hypothetical protein
MIAHRIECHFDHEMVIASAVPKLMPDFTPSCMSASCAVDVTSAAAEAIGG